MKIAYVTNLRAPYRTLQLNEFSKIENIEIKAYYTDRPNENRKWNTNKPEGFEEIDLKGIKIAGKFGYINNGLLDIVKNNDLIMLGCYEQPTYIFLSLLCKFLKKPYILSYDGISTNRLQEKENTIKKFIKSIVINNASYIMGNGTVSKKYFNEVFRYPLDRIYNQYLTVDSDKLNKLYIDREKYRREYREKLKIDKYEKVLIYSGRLIDIKNVDSVIKAISHLDRKDLTFLITGGGELEEELKKLSEELGVKTIITGFMSDQEELFKHYFVGDALILPSSVYEVWGLVVNEAMFAGLPVLVSDICGCSLDLVKNGENGYIIDPFNIEDIKLKINDVLYNNYIEDMSLKSRLIINEWKFSNSRFSLENIIYDMNKNKKYKGEKNEKNLIYK